MKYTKHGSRDIAMENLHKKRRSAESGTDRTVRLTIKEQEYNG
ncbi:hypothetical protein [Paenibacillus amylolyticus]|nr:hypothetical protein [Paenibacillus amylolyticus]WFA83757.1 hypothetical protein OGI70_22480 [Paenibacillus amylolyticus]